MHLAFLNPQGNFDPADSYWTEHPDFGGQLVYVKEVALAMGRAGHRVDILTRRVLDPEWPPFAADEDAYPGAPNVRIVRLPAGGDAFIAKEQLWPHMDAWVDAILARYEREGGLPEVMTAHYADGGYAAARIAERVGVPFTFTGHSLGAQKLDKLARGATDLAALDARFHFASRIAAERVAMNRAGIIITSTEQERYEQYAHPAYQGAVDPSNDAKFRVIPPGVNLEIFNPEPGTTDTVVHERIEAAIARDIPERRRGLPLVIASSRLDRKKNPTGLVEAFVEGGIHNLANLALVVRGLDDPLRERGRLSGEEREILDEIAGRVEHGAPGAVTSFPLNSQEELAAGYRAAAARRGLFALTAHYEPFGLAPLEAMATGLPVVVTQNGGPSESLRDDAGRYGVLIDPGSAESIAAGLRELLEDQERWRHFQKAGLHRVESRYTWDRTAEGYAAAARNLLAGEGAPGEMPVPDRIALAGLETLATWGGA